MVAGPPPGGGATFYTPLTAWVASPFCLAPRPFCPLPSCNSCRSVTIAPDLGIPVGGSLALHPLQPPASQPACLPGCSPQRAERAPPCCATLAARALLDDASLFPVPATCSDPLYCPWPERRSDLPPPQPQRLPTPAVFSSLRFFPKPSPLSKPSAAPLSKPRWRRRAGPAPRCALAEPPAPPPLPHTQHPIF